MVSLYFISSYRPEGCVPIWQTMTDWHFLVKITAHVFTLNPASARVLEKCGFVQEGLLRKHFFKDGQFIDTWMFALFK
jgi:RimJ/RimL family protein N-acetyltransferase